ncbi:hypothetical protein EYR36_012031 [Pleurotus pulmonarius]|nr:hypothetical protein EYR36_012031 [Pleurotus pulmonarius]
MANHSSASSRSVNRPSVEAVISAKLLKEAHTKKRTRKEVDDEKENREPNQAAESKAETDGSYQPYGRILARLINFFTFANNIIEVGIASEINNSSDEASEDDEHNIMKIPLRRKIEDWKIITNKIPGFRDQMISIAANLILRNDVCRHLGRGIESVRSDDCAALTAQAVTPYNKRPERCGRPLGMAT